MRIQSFLTAAAINLKRLAGAPSLCCSLASRSRVASRRASNALNPSPWRLFNRPTGYFLISGQQDAQPHLLA